MYDAMDDSVGLAQISRGGVYGLDHHQIDPAVFDAFPCQAPTNSHLADM
jgi:hypothetical protein